MAGRPREFERQQALAQAMRVFWALGYERAATDTLLAGMGIGRQSLYNAFGDKRALFLEALEHYGLTQMQWLVDLLAAPGSPLGQIRAVLDAWADTVWRHGFTGCLICNSMSEFGRADAEVAAICDRHNGRIEAAFVATLTRARDCGELRPGADPAALALFLANTGLGLAVQGRRGISRERARDICAMAAAALPVQTER